MTVDEAYAVCAAITRREARNFGYGIALLPSAKRSALSAVYAFARRIDDIGDDSAGVDIATTLARLEEARRDLAGVSVEATDPVLVALADAAKRLPIPLPAFGELIDGVEADVRGVRYDTIDGLVHYCRCVAGSIGRLSLGAFGGADDPTAPQRADALGVALQLTNVLRDIREDLRSGRIYLPAQDLARYGAVLCLDKAGDVAGPRVPIVDVMRFEAARAEAWYAEGLRLLPMLDARSAGCAAAMACIYRRLLDRISARPDLALDRRISLSGREKALVALGSLGRAAVTARRSRVSA